MHTYNHEVRDRRVEATRPMITMPPPLHRKRSGGMVSYLLQRNLDYKLAEENGWYISFHAGDSYPRIVIPAPLSTGEVYWQARAIYDYQGTTKVLPRYQSPRASRGDALVVIWPKDKVEAIVVTEGPMDALAAAGTGPYIGVGLMGNNPPIAALFRLSKLLGDRRIVVVADSDSLDAAAMVSAFLASQGRRTRVVFSSPYKDLASTPPEKRKKIIES